jgi:hypothetical protein
MSTALAAIITEFFGGGVTCVAAKSQKRVNDYEKLAYGKRFG